MLDAKSLAVLQSLSPKQNQDEKWLNGTIKGTGRKFGFVVASDGKEYFLAPQEMSKVLPDDEVSFTIIEANGGKQQAQLKKLIMSPTKELQGTFVIRGKGQGVEPLDSRFSGWLFVPPNKHPNCNHEDIVTAKVTRHPWETGKAQAEVIAQLGDSKNNRTWYSLALNEHDIPESFSSHELIEAERLAKLETESFDGHIDLTHLPFLSIDSSSTMDVDDALFAETTDDGWLFHVAIADVSAFIEPNSILHEACYKRLTTTYLPGLTLPMLPACLSQSALSLLEGQTRLALVFQLSVNQLGIVTNLLIQPAKIINHHKLSYEHASQWLNEGNGPESIKDHLSCIHDATNALSRFRAEHANITNHGDDYRIKVDNDFNVTGIEKEPKNIARNLVEEAMIATNTAIAEWLLPESGLFMTHSGFKQERAGEIKKLLEEFIPKTANLDCYSLDGFNTIINEASLIQDFPLLSLLQKRFERGTWLTQPNPHFGLGFKRYTNATSPIRKFADLIIHQQIKDQLSGKAKPVDPETARDLTTRLPSKRKVSNHIENRLRLQWLGKQTNQEWEATVSHMNSNGLILQLEKNGARGFLDLRKSDEDFKYDGLRMLMTSEQSAFQLGQRLNVRISEIKADQLLFSLA